MWFQTLLCLCLCGFRQNVSTSAVLSSLNLAFRLNPPQKYFRLFTKVEEMPQCHLKYCTEHRESSVSENSVFCGSGVVSSSLRKLPWQLTNKKRRWRDYSHICDLSFVFVHHNNHVFLRALLDFLSWCLCYAYVHLSFITENRPHLLVCVFFMAVVWSPVKEENSPRIGRVRPCACLRFLFAWRWFSSRMSSFCCKGPVRIYRKLFFCDQPRTDVVYHCHG